MDVVITLDKAAYIEQAEVTGEALPGLEWIPARESFSIKFPTPKTTESNEK